LISPDGNAVLCSRVESSKLIGQPFAGGWYHTLSDPIKPPPPKPKKVEPIKDFTAYACQCADQMMNVERVATELGVSARSLERLQVGFNGHVVFPMRDAQERVIGMRIRDNGHQWSVLGSHNGLFWPEGLDFSRLWLCEGDCAALLTLGFNAIGRPSCSGGVDYVRGVIRLNQVKHVVIMADNDEAKFRSDGTEFYPGMDGAQRLAKVLRPMVKSLKILLPPRHKDIREWLGAGATHDKVQAICDNTREWENTY
jgi:hypothetical protein